MVFGLEIFPSQNNLGHVVTWISSHHSANDTLEGGREMMRYLTARVKVDVGTGYGVVEVVSDFLFRIIS